MTKFKQKRKNEDSQSLHLSIVAKIGLVYVIAVITLGAYHALLRPTYAFVIYPYLQVGLVASFVAIGVLVLLYGIITHRNPDYRDQILSIAASLVIITFAVGIQLNMTHLESIEVDGTIYHLAEVPADYGSVGIYDVFECQDTFVIFCERLMLETDMGELVRATDNRTVSLYADDANNVFLRLTEINSPHLHTIQDISLR